MLAYWLSPPHIIVIVLFVASLLLGQCNTVASQQLTSEERCGYQPGQFDQTISGHDEIEITVWARANGAFCWRAFLPVEAAKLVSDYKISVRPTAWSNGSDADADTILPAASKGKGPDIAYLGQESINQAYDLGYIEPLDACFKRYPEFEQVRESSVLWLPLTRDGKRLALPVEPSVTAFFYSKTKLHQLGWSDKEIDELPDKIRRGDFTLDDMVNVARQALASGVIRPGFGYWPNFRRRSAFLSLYYTFGGDLPDTAKGPYYLSRATLERIYSFQRQLFVERITYPSFAEHEVGASFMGRNLYQDTVAHGEVLFWSRELSEWKAEYIANYAAELGGEDYVLKTIGYAPFPSAVRGQMPSSRWTNTESYVILTEQATGRRHQDAACALLAQVIQPDIYSRFISSAGVLSVLKPADDHKTFEIDSFESQTLDFWDYVWQWPQPEVTPKWNLYWSVLNNYQMEVELGRVSPRAAVDMVVREMQSQLGNAVIIEP